MKKASSYLVLTDAFYSCAIERTAEEKANEEMSDPLLGTAATPAAQKVNSFHTASYYRSLKEISFFSLFLSAQRS